MISRGGRSISSERMDLHRAVLGGDFNQAFDLGLGQHVEMRRFLHAHEAQNGARGVVQEPVERPEQNVRRVQRVRDPERHGLRVSDGEGLGHLLADDDVERREDQKADQERDQVDGLFAEAERGKHGPHDGRDRGLAHPAEAE
jgi:hypothetical protein